MLILFDITRLISSLKNHYATGVDRVEINYFNYLVAHYNDHLVFVYKLRKKFYIADKQQITNSFIALDAYWKGSNKAILNGGQSIHSFRMKMASKSDILPLRLNNWLDFIKRDNNILSKRLIEKINESKRCIYLNVSHANIENSEFINELKNRNVKIVCLLHDLIPITHSEYCKQSSTDKHLIRVSNMAIKADLIISNSNYTKDEFLGYCQSEGIQNQSEILVSPLGTEILESTDSNEHFLKNNYFLTIGTIEPRKNHDLLLDIWEEMYAEKGDQCPELIIVGRRGWESDSFFKRLDQLKGLTKNTDHF